MVQIKQSGRTAGPGAPRSSSVVWFATAVATALLVSVALAATKSGGLDHVLSKDQLFVPYFTT